jgi:ketosteroid isomerase-like protein
VARRRIRRNLELLNHHELDRYMDTWADDGVLDFPGSVPGVSGTHLGKPAVRAFFGRLFEQFPVIRFSPRHIMLQSPMGFGPKVIAVQWDLDVVNRDGVKGRSSGITVATLRRGKVIHLQDFIFDPGERFHAAWGVQAATGKEQPVPSGVV